MPKLYSNDSSSSALTGTIGLRKLCMARMLSGGRPDAVRWLVCTLMVALFSDLTGLGIAN